MKRADPTPYASGYSVDLYCDEDLPEWLHPQSQSFAGESLRDCLAQARRRGWVIHKETRTATCPLCMQRLRAAAKEVREKSR